MCFWNILKFDFNVFLNIFGHGQFWGGGACISYVRQTQDYSIENSYIFKELKLELWYVKFSNQTIYTCIPKLILENLKFVYWKICGYCCQYFSISFRGRLKFLYIHLCIYSNKHTMYILYFILMCCYQLHLFVYNTVYLPTYFFYNWPNMFIRRKAYVNPI